MTKQKRTRYRVLGLVSLSLIIAAATYGFASMNSTIHGAGVLDAGYGVQSIYDVSRVIYTLNIEDPSTFTAVDFVIEESGAVVIAGVSATKNGQITWADDCEKNDYKWTCTFEESIDVLAADWLHVSSIQ
jgi:hypothetical protein